MKTRRIARALVRSAVAATVALASHGHAVPLPQFPEGSVWNADVSGAAPHPQSTAMLTTLAGICTPNRNPPECGFGLGFVQIDFSIVVLTAEADAPMVPTVAHPDDGYYAPDCDPVGTPVPLPPGGAIEGAPGYQCPNTGDDREDCHLIVRRDNVLYETYASNLAGNTLQTLCLSRWNLDVVYPGEQRGEHCTSADAAGFPIAPLLFNADEIHAALQRADPADRHLGHAIRFILPNNRIASDGARGDAPERNVYVRPATHSGGPVGPIGSVPYGARLRLRDDFPFAGYTPASQVILRTLQKHGMVLADGGNLAFTAESDRYTTHKWSEAALQLNANGNGNPARAFSDNVGATKNLEVADFVVLDTGPRIQETWDCVRTDIPLEPEIGLVFRNGFE